MRRRGRSFRQRGGVARAGAVARLKEDLDDEQKKLTELTEALDANKVAQRVGAESYALESVEEMLEKKVEQQAKVVDRLKKEYAVALQRQKEAAEAAARRVGIRDAVVKQLNELLKAENLEAKSTSIDSRFGVMLTDRDSLDFEVVLDDHEHKYNAAPDYVRSDRRPDTGIRMTVREHRFKLVGGELLNPDSLVACVNRYAVKAAAFDKRTTEREEVTRSRAEALAGGKRQLVDLLEAALGSLEGERETVEAESYGPWVELGEKLRARDLKAFDKDGRVLYEARLSLELTPDQLTALVKFLVEMGGVL